MFHPLCGPLEVSPVKNDIPGSKLETDCSGLPLAYQKAFRNAESLFLRVYPLPGDVDTLPVSFTRGQFLDMSLRAVQVLVESGLEQGERFLNGFTSNNPVDLCFRLAAAITRTTPVTLNWQADTSEKAAYKAAISEARLMLTDGLLPKQFIDSVISECPDIHVFDTNALQSEIPRQIPTLYPQPSAEEEKVIIFTSGTTGKPKGVVLTWGNYDTNALTFREMFSSLRKDPMQLVLVNPLHHANSSAMSDWFMREPGALIHIFPRYTTSYWKFLADIAERADGLVIAPAVSRHFDFLESLASRKELPVEEGRLRHALSRVSFLLGSAPVGPTTVERVTRWTGRIPLVRFGSTETCLQVLGTPVSLDDEELLKSFQAGWNRTPSPGYYIGRAHPPYTEAMVVKSATPGEPGYMRQCGPDQEGYLVARGGNIMKEYLENDQSTDEVIHSGWYSGFGDICFYLLNPHDGESDYYWLGRDSGLLIRGGANYSCDQIAIELKQFIREQYCIGEGVFDLAVAGVRLESEHEDTCCVTIEDCGIEPGIRKEIEATFITEASISVSKGARPQKLIFAPIPRNFKGAVNTRDLKRIWMSDTN